LCGIWAAFGTHFEFMSHFHVPESQAISQLLLI